MPSHTRSWTRTLGLKRRDAPLQARAGQHQHPAATGLAPGSQRSLSWCHGAHKMPRAWRGGCAHGKVSFGAATCAPASLACAAAPLPSTQFSRRAALLACLPACLPANQSLTHVLSLHSPHTPLDCSPGPPEAVELPKRQPLAVPGGLPGGAARCWRHCSLLLQAPRARYVGHAAAHGFL